MLFASQAAPRLLGIDLRKDARRVLAELGGADLNLDSDQSSSFPLLVSRGFSVVAAAGKTVAAVEAELDGNATIESVRRADEHIPVTRAFLLNKGDEVAVSGLRTALADASHVVGPELSDPTAVKFIVETRDVVLTHRPMHGSAMADIIKFLRTSDCHGVYLAGITRMERVLPLLPGSKVRLGDVLRLFGKPEDVARAAGLLGEASAPDNVTDFVYLGGGLVIGIMIGMVTVPFAGASLSLGSAGALLSGLAFGWLRSLRPTFGKFPSAAMQILKDLGLIRLHCLHRTDFRTEHSSIAGAAWLGTADRGDISFASAAIGFALYRPLFAAYRACDTLRCNRGSACQHAGDQCD